MLFLMAAYVYHLQVIRMWSTSKGFSRYTFTYSNGIIRCGEIPDINHCARQTCECDRKTVMCLMNPENSEANSEVEKKCYRKFKTCFQPSEIKKLLFGTK
ncbi:uncharacterized protein [Dendrobates tinctorius]|uniref:uncharacterized protein isoform X2 n=1 Tax=Dendrobates tinctorius TaxID=92724 RepID=UPI003CC92AA7